MIIASRGARADEPTTAPANPKVSALIQQLGDDDPAVRKNARDQLMAEGDDAKAQVQLAENDDDPQIRTQAREIYDDLSVPPLPDIAPPGVVLPNVRTFSFGSNKIGDIRNTTSTLRGRTTQIAEGPDGIQMTVTGYINGQRTTKQYKAENVDQLKLMAPQWYDLWANSGGGTGRMTLNNGQIIINGGNLIIPAPGAQPPQIVLQPFMVAPQARPAPSDDLAQLRMDLDKEMGKLTNAQRAAVLAHLAKVNLAQQEVGIGTDPEKANQHYLDECDAMRKAMTDVGLADPGTLLPPPASSRLGVTVGAAGELPGSGVVVSSVMEGSRAQKMGVKEYDTISEINDKPISDVNDLRTAVMAGKKLKLGIVRGGQAITLDEAADAKAGK